MDIHNEIKHLRQALTSAERIAFVPTMGHLHAGHLALVKAAHQYADTVVASIFVNRLQFGAGEDFDQYPRTFAEDCEKLRQAGVHHLFAPTEAIMYPEPQSYFVEPPDLQHLLEGACRPGHFRGVATVVLKLFNAVSPQYALFGKKDYQQLMVVRAMTRQLGLPIDIVGIETVRAEDGLALSSRNSYLSAAERQEAPRLFQTLQSLRDAVQHETSPLRMAELEQAAADHLNQHGWQTDYISVRRQDNLLPPPEWDESTPFRPKRVILAAARLGKTRLLDNLEIET